MAATNETWRKYELTDITAIHEGLHRTPVVRIRACRDIPAQNVKAGDLGGWVQSEANLSHAGDAWIADDAKAFEEAVVAGNALVSGRARVCTYAVVAGEAWVRDSALVNGTAVVTGEAEIDGTNHVGGGQVVRS